jgi:transcriptional regulator with XRE-family HTH domain
MSAENIVKSPFVNTEVAKLIRRRIQELSSRKTQRKIASEVGYNKPNMISMIKCGDTKLPFEKIPVFAESLEIDVAYLFRISLEQYWPDYHKVISNAGIEILTKSERDYLATFRLTSSESTEK